MRNILAAATSKSIINLQCCQFVNGFFIILKKEVIQVASSPSFTVLLLYINLSPGNVGQTISHPSCLTRSLRCGHKKDHDSIKTGILNRVFITWKPKVCLFTIYILLWPLRKDFWTLSIDQLSLGINNTVEQIIAGRTGTFVATTLLDNVF